MIFKEVSKKDTFAILWMFVIRALFGHAYHTRANHVSARRIAMQMHLVKIIVQYSNAPGLTMDILSIKGGAFNYLLADVLDFVDYLGDWDPLWNKHVHLQQV